MSTLPLSYRIKILETHLDFFGHVNNATYLQLFEEARWEMITLRGFGADKIQKLGQGPVILAVEMQFLKELYLREEITIHTETLEYDKKIGKLKQTMLKTDGSVSCLATFTFGLFDLKERKLIPPTPEWKRACGLE
jgi:acyl-CoA thioester hydrolase